MNLNDAQLRVLRWVADGCPEGVMQGYSHRGSASALRSRALLRITGHGPTWNATLTPQGKLALADLETGAADTTRSGEATNALKFDDADRRKVAARQAAKTEQRAGQASVLAQYRSQFACGRLDYRLEGLSPAEISLTSATTALVHTSYLIAASNNGGPISFWLSNQGGTWLITKIVATCHPS